MREKKVKKELNSVEKLYILLQPYIRKREIKAVLQCSAKKAADVFDMALDGYMSLQKGREWTKGPLYFPENGALPLDKL